MAHPIQIKQINISDAPTLLEISRKTFFDAFLHLNNKTDIEAYASTAFTIKKIEQELSNPNSHFFFVLVDRTIAGYIKLNYRAAQTELQDPEALEVERIYVLNDFQGRQIGKQLIDFAIQTARYKQLKYIWLGVWEHNTGAIKFYKSKGFEEFGSHPFMLGNDKQTDIMMKLVLNRD